MNAFSVRQAVEDRIDQGLEGQWYIVAKSTDVLDGQPFAVHALGRRLVVWRANGQTHCLEDYCPHRGARLSFGGVLGDNIACRYHGVVVNGEGRIVQVPAMANCPLEGRAAVKHFATREAAGAIFAYFPSAAAPEPTPFHLPAELTDPEYTSFLCTGIWDCNYRYVLDNIADPMHGSYLHGDTFTLADGGKQDLIQTDKTDEGFIVSRVGQRDLNFDWAEIIADAPLTFSRLDIPYPPPGGPGGPMRIVAFVTPTDTESCRIFFFRIRKVSGLKKEVWRFMFRARFEPRHWYVLEQDRELLASMPTDARRREMLYQHDVGLTRVRKALLVRAKAQVEAEEALATANRPARSEATVAAV